MRWNKTLNLTKRSEPCGGGRAALFESLFLGAAFAAGESANRGYRVGRRLSGFPVAVLRPDCAVTLIESHQRKAVFLREASRNLANVRVIGEAGGGGRETIRLGDLAGGEL